MLRYGILGFFLLVNANLAIACSCPWPLDLQKSEGSAEYVFTGSLERKNPFLSLLSNRYKFKVLQAYKGAPETIVTVWSPKVSASCGIDMDRKADYVVFVYKDSDEEKQYVGRCSTWPMNDSWEVWTEEFKQLHPDS